MLLGVLCKLVELLSQPRMLLLPLLDLFPDLNKNITSEPLVKMLLVTSIKKLLQSKLFPQIMVVKLLFLLIPLTKENLRLVMPTLTFLFSIWLVPYLKDLLFQNIELLMTLVDTVESPPQLFQKLAEEEEECSMLLVTVQVMVLMLLLQLLNQPLP